MIAKMNKKISFRFVKTTEFRVAVFAFMVLLVGTLGYFSFEETSGDILTRLGNSFWWAIVTMGTVGYGDFTANTFWGRVVGVFVILFGVGFISLLSGGVASYFVERKIREAKGLETVKFKNHIVLCGWNADGKNILKYLAEHEKETKDVVIICQLDENEATELLSIYKKSINLKFVKGDHTHEHTLKRGSVHDASVILIIPDSSAEGDFSKADEKTILATLAIKTLNPKVKTYAELLNSSNIPHLLRANIDDFFVRGDFSSYILSNFAIYQGVSQTLKSLTETLGEKGLISLQILPNLAEKNFSGLSSYFREKRGAILIGIAREEKELGLEGILSPDTSAIDDFIKRKFTEAEKGFYESKQKVNVILNPSDSFKVNAGDYAIIIDGEIDAKL